VSLDTAVQTVQLSRDRLRKNASLRPSLLRQCRDICGTPGTVQLAGFLTAAAGVASNGRARGVVLRVLRATLGKLAGWVRTELQHARTRTGAIRSEARR
jgi:hypothetical protein